MQLVIYVKLFPHYNMHELSHLLFTHVVACKMFVIGSCHGARWRDSTYCLGTFYLWGTLALCNATNLDCCVSCRFDSISVFAQSFAHYLEPNFVYLMKMLQHGWFHGRLNICLITKSSIKGCSRRPWLSHKVSCTLIFISFGVFGGFRPWSTCYRVEKCSWNASFKGS
jgi:hypothetical protein